ncbi:MAG: hypothetical protein WC197_01610 [Candidatus Gastranaerophilaceae bacterium]|jgi:hypothetical protein
MSYLNNIGNYGVNSYNPVFSDKKIGKEPLCSNSIKNQKSADIPFNGIFADFFAIKKFNNKQDKAMYDELKASLPDVDKQNLDVLLKTGKLSNKASNDGSSTLENLYKILKNPRTRGLNIQKILGDTIETLANPYRITQRFGELPPELSQRLIAEEKNKQMHNALGLSAEQVKKPNDPESAEDLNITNSACCVAASIEFNLADKKPAEFARYVEGLTGSDNAVKVKMHYSDVSNNFIDALSLLNQFHSNAKPLDWNSLEVTVAPDRAAIIRARVQNTQINPKERNVVDTLMQSTFMQLGSQGTYNSLTDKRYGSFNTNDKGLTEFEKNFAETIVDNDGGKTSVTYQNVDENARLIGYNADYNTILTHLQKTLDSGSNIIIGITEADQTNKIIGGHEMTIKEIKKGNKDNELYFICNDTDDDYVGAVEIKAKALIPKIHHAGIPNKILGLSPQVEDTGFALLKEYEKAQK